MHIHAFKFGVFIPEVTEMEAILKAMQTIVYLGWSSVCVESDASIVIK